MKDLYELQYELHKAKDDRNEVGGVRSYINLERTYVARWNPLNLSLVDDWFEIEDMDEETRKVNTPSVIFELMPSSYALVTVDFRHLAE